MEPRTFLAGLIASGALPAPAAPALAARAITPLSPKAGETVPAGQSPTFKLRVRGSGQQGSKITRFTVG